MEIVQLGMSVKCRESVQSGQLKMAVLLQGKMSKVVKIVNMV